MLTRLALLTALLLAPGCYSFGQKRISDNRILTRIQPGKSTKADVETAIGKPISVAFSEVGEQWIYVYSNHEAKAATFVPIVGLFAGGSKSETHTLTVLFDDAGVVKKMGKGQSKQDHSVIGGSKEIDTP